MKMSTTDYNALSEAVLPLNTPERRAAYRAGNYPRAGFVKDVNKRYRWDLFWAARMPLEFTDTLYRYLNDAHIDTALKKLVPEL